MATVGTQPPTSRGEAPEAAYLYVGADGQPHMLVCRYPGKRFLQYRPDGHGGWLAGLAGLQPVPYRLPQLLAHLAANSAEPLYICEGEKDAEAVVAAGGVATCNPMGAGKWHEHYSEWLQGARTVLVVADDDDVGHGHAAQVVASLATVGVAATVVLPATGKDAADHLAAGHGIAPDAWRPYQPTPAAGEPGAGPVFLDAYEFVDLQVEPPAPLWGDRETTLIPAGGLVVVAGRPGVGKTTWVVDLACHLAAGQPYPPPGDDRAPAGWPVPRALRVALIENEGPLEMFRDKLGAKLARWPHPPAEAGGWLGIQVWRWGAFSFADRDAYERAGAELDERSIDLVIGDPLTMLGMEGVGSPAETRVFVQLLRGLGLGQQRAFLFLHHFRERVERNEDELARISGAWGGHLDTLLTLQPMGRTDELRLGFPKLRWGRGRAPEPTVLGRIYATQSYATLRKEGDLSGLEPLLVQALEERRTAGDGYGPGGWGTYSQLAAVAGGGRRRNDTKRALEAAPHLFACATGSAAKALGAKHNAILWGLCSWPEAPDAPPPELAPAPAGQPGHVQPSLGEDFPF